MQRTRGGWLLWRPRRRSCQVRGSIRTDQSRLSARLKRTLVLSLVLHVVVLLVAVGLRLPQHGERPLTSVEVSLVSLPTPVRQAEQAKPVESAKVSDPKPAPAPLVKAVAPSAVPYLPCLRRARKEGT